MQRVLTTVIALPTLLFLIVCLPQHNYLAFAILIVVISILGNYEMYNMLTKGKNWKIQSPPWLGAFLPAAAYIQYSYLPEYDLTTLVLVVLLILVFSLEMMNGYDIDGYRGSGERMAVRACLLVYPSLIATFFVRFCFLENAWVWIITLLGLCFASDTFAYVFGMLFGKNNKGIIKVSPNKSVAGYIAGISIPSLLALLLTAIFPIYGMNPFSGLLLGLLTAVGAALGDLIESCFKRSSGVKDSGHVIPGRGGMMDSIDSLLVAAPIFYFVVYILT